MLDLLLTVFRYLFLVILYVFIFQLIKMMFQDLGKAGEPAAEPAGKRKTGRELPEPPRQEEYAPPPGAEAGLVVITSGDPGLTPGSVFPLGPEGEAGLGRSSRNTITLVDPFASMEHAAVYKGGGQYWLVDKGSKNGTFLNEIKLSRPTVLADGDRIRIGGVTLQFVRWAYEVESDDGSGSRKEKERG
ncbi:MAG: FHA domain-containing protein [Bacillota bacterium]